MTTENTNILQDRLNAASDNELRESLRAGFQQFTTRFAKGVLFDRVECSMVIGDDLAVKHKGTVQLDLLLSQLEQELFRIRKDKHRIKTTEDFMERVATLVDDVQQISDVVNSL
jgi:hypothetical protein